MAIIEEKLAEFELSTGHQVTIEWNEGDKIHIHIDNIRYSLKKKEFEKFATILKEAEDNLTNIKNTNAK